MSAFSFSGRDHAVAISQSRIVCGLLLAAFSLNSTAQVWLPPERTPVDVVIAVKAGSNRAAATGAEEIIALVTDAHASSKPVEAVAALGSPTAAFHTFGRFDYPASVVIPETSAIRKMKQPLHRPWNPIG